MLLLPTAKSVDAMHDLRLLSISLEIHRFLSLSLSVNYSNSCADSTPASRKFSAIHFSKTSFGSLQIFSGFLLRALRLQTFPTEIITKVTQHFR